MFMDLNFNNDIFTAYSSSSKLSFLKYNRNKYQLNNLIPVKAFFYNKIDQNSDTPTIFDHCFSYIVLPVVEIDNSLETNFINQRKHIVSASSQTFLSMATNSCLLDKPNRLLLFVFVQEQSR